MQHFRSLDDVHLGDCWLTIGSFDGIHKGHQSIVSELITEARENDAPAVLVTFYPHPVSVLRGRNFPYYLSSPEEKADFLASLGIDVVITHPFNRLVANRSANQFIENLSSHMKIRHLQIGYDFAMGKNREGDFKSLLSIGKSLGFSVKKSPPIEDEGGILSSSRIRFLLGVGQVSAAANLLGRNYSLQGIVEIGDQRGATLGFPTANLMVWAEKIIPTAGVYACLVNVKGQTWGAVTNIGVRPTFESQPVAPRVETHILDFSEDIYGESVQLEFVARIRDEKRFPSIKKLVEQIRMDTIQARKILFA
jgi:riboflavin kinase/FMN adenylyltransferase